MAITARWLKRSEAMPVMPDPLCAQHPLRTAEKVYRSSQPGKATRFRAVGLCSLGPAWRRMGMRPVPDQLRDRFCLFIRRAWGAREHEEDL